MRVRFLLGPAGSGKTWRCLDFLRRRLAASPEGRALVLLAPKQATFQLERQLLARPELAGYTRLSILSFERLAEHVLARLGHPAPPLLDEEGRVMVLRALLMRHERDLCVYRSTARLPGFARQLSEMLREFQRHGHTPERLAGLSARWPGERGLGGKLRDLSLLARAYREWLAAHQLHDAQSLPDHALDALHGAAHSQAPRARLDFEALWLDGFAELTPQELALLAAVIPFSDEAHLAFCLDARPPDDLTWLSCWSHPAQCYRRCHQALAGVPGVEIEVEELPRDPGASRFGASPGMAWLERNWTRDEPEPEFESDASPISIAQCASPTHEVEVAARAIRTFARQGGRYRDCAVLLRSFTGYDHTLRRILARYDIPFFLDQREPVTHHPMAELTRQALRVAALNWRHDDWFGALKTGLVTANAAAIDELENEALARGWTAAHWRQPLVLADAPVLQERLEALRCALVPPFERLAASLRDAATGLQLAAALRAFWDDLDVGGTLERWSQAAISSRSAAAHLTVWQQMHDWADNVALGFGDQALPLRDWMPILEAGLAGLTVGVVPPAIDQVMIGAVDRSRNPDLRLAIVLGLNEGVFPMPPANRGLLTESDREELAGAGLMLSADTRGQISRERYLGYIALTRPRERLLLTCACQDEQGRVRLPSPFLSRLKQIAPHIAWTQPSPVVALEDVTHVCELAAPWIVYVREAGRHGKIPAWPAALEPWRAALEPLARYAPDAALPPDTARRLYGPRMELSVTALERYAACPFQFLVQAGLRAAERARFELEARESGSYQHAVLRRFHETLVVEGLRWRDLSRDDALRRLDQAGAAVADEFNLGLMRASAANAFAMGRMLEDLRQWLGVILEWMGRYSFDPALAETRFSPGDAPLPSLEWTLEEGVTLALRGIIDRIDVCRLPDSDCALAAVVDYKSGDRKPDPVRLQHGIELQLPAYLAILRALPDARARFGVRRLIPAGAFYSTLRVEVDAGSTRGEPGEDPRDALRKACGHEGRLNLDYAAYFDNGNDAAPGGQFHLKRNKDGSWRKHNNAMASKEFEDLLNHTLTLIQRFGSEILHGAAGIEPYIQSKKTPCKHCQYPSVCRVDPWTQCYRKLAKAASPAPSN